MAKSNQAATAASAPESTEAASSFDPSKLKVKRQVTLPILKLMPDTPVYVRIDGAIFEGKQLKRGDQENMKPADLMNVTDLVTGESMQIVCGEVLKSTLREEYPNDGYVGKAFRITKGKRKDKEGGRGYFTYAIAELELPK